MTFLRALAAVTLVAALMVSAGAPAAASSPSTPVQHTYDDGHTDDTPTGSGPALWILIGAVTGLTLIGGVLIWHGRPSSRSRPGPPDQE